MTKTVALAVVNADRLLCVRKSPRHRWILPGGQVQPGETDLAALRREITEELACGVQPSTVRWLGTFAGTSPDEIGVDADQGTEVRCWTGVLDGPPTPSSEITALAWLALAQPHYDRELAAATRWALEQLR